MNRRFALLAAGALAAIVPAARAAAPIPPPNLVIILADDLGRADYSAFGTRDIRTPYIDRLCREGMTFDNFRAASCVCSPTRAALLTGCHPDRVGVPGVIRHTPENSWGRLAPEATLLPRALRRAGYHCAIVGKWHLGLEPPDTPNERGFDFFHGFLGDMMDDYRTHRRGGRNFMRRDAETIDPQGHATDLFTEWACAHLERRARVPGPFFLYLAYNAPHNPLHPPADWLERVRRREPGLGDPRARLVALIEHMDEGIGRVLATIDRLGIARHTLVLFTSDNGGALEFGANAGPWRAGKGHMYEGGLRVPAAARWPGTIAPGTRTALAAVTTDIFATCCDAAGLPVPAGTDAISFLPTLLGRAQAPVARDLYFVRREGGALYGGKTIEALVRGDWKLLQDSPFAPLELYHLGRDPRETTNVAAAEKAVFRELSAALRAQVQRGGAVPWQEPDTAR